MMEHTSPKMSNNILLVFCVFFSAFVRGSLVCAEPLESSVVKHWSEKVQDYLLTLAKEGLKTQELQKLYDNANYTVEHKDGFKTISSVKAKLGNYFIKKEKAAWVSFSHKLIREASP